MEAVYLVILVALLGDLILAFRAGAARGAFNVMAPAMSGHPTFERRFRIHMNTVENLIVFIPAVLLFGYYLSSRWAAILGVAFILARIVYAVRYEKDPESRQPGFAPGFMICIALILGGGFGIVKTLLM